ncbi:MAG: tripartite tricarboxylate transporter substrate binding protein [Burkholderiales bacterium]|nr:tripartite tricarboxylate transporter substrate binding protein [Burkholderiales bacterium]
MANFRFPRPVAALAVIVTLSAAAVPSIGLAQDYPTRPIRIVVGFAPGGVTDAIPRLLAEPLAQRLGQPVIVENRAGAGGALAVTAVAQSAPDGYTLLGGGVGQIVVLPHTSKNLPIDPARDLVHISMTGEGDQFFSINPEVPAKNYAEFAALVKANPGKYFYGDAGAGGNLHLYVEYFKMLAGLDMAGLHYKGGSEIMVDLLANRIQMSLNTAPVIRGYVQQGRLRPILAIARQRSAEFPDVPTVGEVGLKPLEAASNWFSLHAPKGTPEPVVRKIHAALIDALKTDAVKAGLAKLDIRAVGDTPEEFSRRIADDYRTFGDIVRRANIRSE